MAFTTFERPRTLDGNIPGKSFARRVLDRYIDAKMRRARLSVNAYLQNLDDEALSRLGYTPSDIRDIRRSDGIIPLIG